MFAKAVMHVVMDSMPAPACTPAVGRSINFICPFSYWKASWRTAAAIKEEKQGGEAIKDGVRKRRARQRGKQHGKEWQMRSYRAYLH